MASFEFEGKFEFTDGADSDQNAMLNRAQELFAQFSEIPEGGSERIARLQTQRGVEYVIASGGFATESEGLAVYNALVQEATLRAALVPHSQAWLKERPDEGDVETLRAWPE